MAETKQTEIPQQARDAVLHSIGQARTAYHQLMEAAHKAQDMLKMIAPPNPATAGVAEVQERAMRFTQQNLDASFGLANELAGAVDLQEALQIQSRHAQLQMQAYTLQAQELGAMVTAAAQKAKQGS